MYLIAYKNICFQFDMFRKPSSIWPIKLISMTVWNSFWTMSNLAGLRSFQILLQNIFHHDFILHPPLFYTLDFPEISHNVCFIIDFVSSFAPAALLSITHCSHKRLVIQLQVVPCAGVRDHVRSSSVLTAYHYSLPFFSRLAHKLSTEFDLVSHTCWRSPPRQYILHYSQLYLATTPFLLTTQFLYSLSSHERSLHSAGLSHHKVWTVVIYLGYRSINAFLFISCWLKSTNREDGDSRISCHRSAKVFSHRQT